MTGPDITITHAVPLDGLTPCCRRTPFELPRADRMTSDPEAVTCNGRIPAPSAFVAVDDRHGRPARVEDMSGPSLRHYFRGGVVRPDVHDSTMKPRTKGRLIREERDTLADDLAILLPMDDLKRTIAQAADDLARRLFADTPLALASIVRTGIVPWDIEYQTTTDGTTLERVTRLVEYERGARRG